MLHGLEEEQQTRHSVTVERAGAAPVWTANAEFVGSAAALTLTLNLHGDLSVNLVFKTQDWLGSSGLISALTLGWFVPLLARGHNHQ